MWLWVKHCYACSIVKHAVNDWVYTSRKAAWCDTHIAWLEVLKLVCSSMVTSARMAARSSPCSCAAPFPACPVYLGLSHTQLFPYSEVVKPYHGNRMRKLVCAKRQGNFTVKAKEGVRPCRWDCRDTAGAFCYPTAVGQTQWSPKAWPSSEGDISEGLPGQKGEMGPARGIGSAAAVLVGQSPSFPVVPEGA